MTKLNVFNLDLNQLADSGSGCSQKTDYKIPEHFIIILEAGFEILVIRFADHIFQKSFLLHSDKGEFPLLLTDTFQVAIDGS